MGWHIQGSKCKQVSSDFGKIDKAAFSEPLALNCFKQESCYLVKRQENKYIHLPGIDG